MKKTKKILNRYIGAKIKTLECFACKQATKNVIESIPGIGRMHTCLTCGDSWLYVTKNFGLGAPATKEVLPRTESLNFKSENIQEALAVYGRSKESRNKYHIAQSRDDEGD